MHALSRSTAVSDAHLIMLPNHVLDFDFRASCGIFLIQCFGDSWSKFANEEFKAIVGKKNLQIMIFYRSEGMTFFMIIPMMVLVDSDEKHVK